MIKAERKVGVTLPAAPVRTSPPNLKGERALRPAHASATCAYPRDALSELTPPRPLAQVERRTCARWSSCVHRRRCALRSPDPRGRVLDSARPCPSRGWVPASQPGSEDLPERREHRSAQRCARPLACSCARSPLGASHAHSVCRTSQVSICELSGAMGTAWVALAQL